MLGAFGRAFRTRDLRNKLLFVIFIVLIYRLGAVVPSPGVDEKAIHDCLQLNESNAAFQLINLFSGGALLQLSIFALGIMPYITSSIIIQLLTVVIPRLESLKQEGQTGTTKLTQYTRYLTIALAILESAGIVALARSGQLLPGCQSPIIPDTSVFRQATMIITMVAGTGVVMWLGELITDRGIGNGMSILIMTSIASRMPSQGNQIRLQKGNVVFAIVILLGIAIIAAVVFVEQAQRRIPVQYAKRMVGRKSYGGTSTYLPLKVNQAGVIPVIFASSLLYIPQLIGQVTSNEGLKKWMTEFSKGNHPLYMLIYFVLIIFFAYFYVAITFNPDEVSDNMKKYGGFIPGIRPGRPTAEYLSYVLNRLTAPGALYLAIIALIPVVALSFLGASSQFPFGGTAILILVGVGIDFVKQVESQLMLRNYEGFLR